MGYMGLGMQKWIYTQRPRKPFSKRSKITSNTTEIYSVSDLNIKGRTSLKNLTEEQRKRVLDRINRRHINGKILNIFIILSVIVMAIILLNYYKPWNTKSYSENYLKEENRRANKEKQQVYDLAMSYGKNHLIKNDYSIAISEFHNALEAFPENREALDFLLKAYIQDCLRNNNNCNKSKRLLDKMIKLEPNNFDYQSYKIELDKKVK